MDFISLIETLGVPIAVSLACMFYIYKQGKFIQEQLQVEMRESFTRQEGIIIGLINALKKISIDLKGVEKSYKALVEIITKLEAAFLDKKSKDK